MKLLANSSEINQAIAKVAREIMADFAGTQPLFVVLLRGAAPFASKLLFEIAKQAPEMHPEADYMTISTYGEERKASSPHIVMDLAPDTELENRTVIILDDVLDKGVTSSFVADTLFERGVKEVKLAALVEKDIDRKDVKSADYVCFHAGEEWLIGMGMDDASVGRDGYRWLDEIRIV